MCWKIMEDKCLPFLKGYATSEGCFDQEAQP